MILHVDGPIDPALARSARSALGWRGRVFVVAPIASLPRTLLSLSASGLQAKRLVMPDPGQADALVVAVQGRPGGLVVDRLSLC
ncbi:MAG: hypothetical protein HY898_35950 [Deltaproteobacteria bacterium]|nr:hypothetical protein [Deltaproteobacteria bacterium]